MQPQHEMLVLAMALLSKGLHPLPTAKAAAADVACYSARNCPLLPRLLLLRRHQPCCRCQTATGLKKAASAAVPLPVVPLQNCNTQNIVGFDHERGVFSTDFFQMVCRK
jgi:hypothetical protein